MFLIDFDVVEISIPIDDPSENDACIILPESSQCHELLG